MLLPPLLRGLLQGLLWGVLWGVLLQVLAIVYRQWVCTLELVDRAPVDVAIDASCAGAERRWFRHPCGW